MCLEVPACFCLYQSKRNCCFFFSLKQGVNLMPLADLLEALISVGVIALGLVY